MHRRCVSVASTSPRISAVFRRKNLGPIDNVSVTRVTEGHEVSRLPEIRVP